MSKVTEHEIRPAELFQAYLDLCDIDIVTHFTDSPRTTLDCPACDDPGEHTFDKGGFAYRECPVCHTLWVSPRPAYEAFARFYSDSPSSRYWAEVFYPTVEAVRREKLWKPKARQVADISRAQETTLLNLIDIGGGNGVFAEEYRSVSDCDVLVIEPSVQSAQACRERGIPVLKAFLEEVTPEQIPKGPSIFTSFELFEHVHDPRTWLASLASLMRSQDLLIVTTLSGLGLDIRTLWQDSRAVMPPAHLNFLNPGAMTRISTTVGLEVVQVFTPGVLDMDILRNNIDRIGDRFWRSVIETSSEEELQAWQELVSSLGRSSHMWAVLRKA
jgi:hypothetical protein